MLCEKCNKIIDSNRQYCKYCGHEHLLKKPFSPYEYRKQTGIYIDLRSDTVERLSKDWEKYNEQHERIQNGKFNKKEKINIKNFFKEVSIYNLGLFICGIMLILAILDLPYFYYQLLRAIISVVSFYILLRTNTIVPIKLFLGISLILFNPFEPFMFKKDTWFIIDILFGTIYLSTSLFDHFKIFTLTSERE